MRFCPRCGTRFETEGFCPHDGEATEVLPDAPAPELLIGQIVDGRYRVEKQIGEGGMGVVFRATHTSLNKTVALKVLRGEMAKDASVVQRFIQEAQAATSIGHENIIDISDFGKMEDGSVYFVMEFLDGLPLTDLVSKGGSVPVASAVRIIRQMAGAVGAAHDSGIVHRDLKPDNIFLIPRGDSNEFVKVLDFGIAKVGGASNKLTQTGMVFGTPHYMSPEQAAGQSVDLRTDIYALGVIMYEMFTGHVPFDADTFMGVLTKHMFEEPPPMVRTGDERMLGALEAVTLKALAKKPENRYQTMGELCEDLNRAAGGDVPNAASAGPNPSSALADELEPRSMDEMNLEQQAVLAAPDPTRFLIMGGLGGLAIVGAAIAFVLTLDDPAPKKRSRPKSTVAAVDAAAASAGSPSSGGAGSAVSAPTPPHPEEPPKPSVALSVVEIVSVPPGASLVVDGAIIGTTPARLPRPKSSKNKKIELKLDGYQSQSLAISKFSPGQILVPLARVVVQHRQAAPARRPAPAAYNPPPRRTRRRRTEVLDPWAE